jgi:DNA-binding CsgD family transcriptional regulator
MTMGRDKQKSAENSRKWYLANREKARETRRQWYLANSERARESARRWRLANPEKFQEAKVRKLARYRLRAAAHRKQVMESRSRRLERMKAMRAQGMTQKEIAKAEAMSQTYVSKYLKGMRRGPPAGTGGRTGEMFTQSHNE